MMRTRTKQFSKTAKWLHWLVAFFLLSVVFEAFSFAWKLPEDRGSAIMAHVSIGMIVLVLTLFRLAVRAVKRPPPLPEDNSRWMTIGAHIGHFLLYAIILLMSFIGLLMAAASPVDIRIFSGLNVSALAESNPELIETLRPLHFAGAVLFVLVLTGHVLGALWHHFISKDDVLLRMLPFTRLADKERKRNKKRKSWRTPSNNGIDWGDRRTWFVDK